MREQETRICIYWVEKLDVENYPKYVDSMRCFKFWDDALRELGRVTRRPSTVEVSIIYEETTRAVFSFKWNNQDEPCRSLAYRYLYTFCQVYPIDLDIVLMHHGCPVEERDKILQELEAKYKGNKGYLDTIGCPTTRDGRAFLEAVKLLDSFRRGRREDEKK